MTGLVLKLGPKERILINGAVIENGDRRGRVNILTPNAKILRLKDAIHPKDATTPVKRVCYVMQLVLSGDARECEAKVQLIRGLEQLSQVFQDSDSRTLLASATDYVIAGQVYPALKALKKLISREERLMLAGEQ